MKNLYLLVIVAFYGCTSVQYSLTSVPEEGGIKFTRMTEEEESIFGPNVEKDDETGLLTWYAAPMVAASADGKHIAYIGVSNNFSNLYIKEVRGGNKKVQRTFNKNVADMAFSPDAERIAFSVNDNGNYNIYTMDAFAGARMTQVTAESAQELGPCYSVSGEEIFFTSEEFGRYYVWNSVVSTGLKTQYSEGFTPVATPDGEGLLVTRNNKDSKFAEIWMIDLETGSETIILSDPKAGFSSPSVSPDGKTIACVGVTPKSENRPQNLDIYSINLDGTQLTQLTFHGGHDVSPIWSHDGQSIYFLSQRGNESGSRNVWRMDF